MLYMTEQVRQSDCHGSNAVKESNFTVMGIFQLLPIKFIQQMTQFLSQFL